MARILYVEDNDDNVYMLRAGSSAAATTSWSPATGAPAWRPPGPSCRT